MNKKMLYFVAFTVGVSLGALTTWQIVKKKYEEIARDEIDSVIQEFEEFKGKLESKVKLTIVEENNDELLRDERIAYENTINGLDYSNLSKNVECVELNEGDDNQVEESDYEESSDNEADILVKPYVIPPEEFGETGYETISLTYYIDKVLTDHLDNKVEDVDSMVGLESLTTFGEYEDDSVFVRNEKNQCDYEILLDHRKYSNVIKQQENISSGNND